MTVARRSCNTSPCYCPQSEFESGILAVQICECESLIIRSIHNLHVIFCDWLSIVRSTGLLKIYTCELLGVAYARLSSYRCDSTCNAATNIHSAERLNVGRTGTDIPWRLGSVSCELTCGYLENQLGTLWMVSLSGESRNHDVMSNNSDFLTGGTLAMMLPHQRLA